MAKATKPAGRTTKKTSKSSAPTSLGATLASIECPRQRATELAILCRAQLLEARAAWQSIAHEQQLPPRDRPDWRTWLFLGGRGAGKTRAGAEWLSGRAAEGGRLALVGPSLHDVREVMIEGPSGLRAVAPPDARPRYEASRRRLVWDSGAVAYVFSAEDPESLRGPQFTAAWADEFCAWRKPGETLALLRMGLRLGARPQLAVTTTPRPLPALKTLRAEASLVESHAGTAVNALHLAPDFLRELETLYGGTRLAAQELEGLVVEADARLAAKELECLVVEADEGALWRAADLARCRGAAPPRFEAVVVAVGREGSRAYVLADASVRGLSPLGWAAKVVEAAERWGASRVVAEVNQGGDMVRSVLATAGCGVPIRSVHATRSKRARAAPVAALYEQGRVVHAGSFPALEEELMALGAAEGAPSPDRADALVWAVADLMLGPDPAPRLRVL